MIGIQTHPFEPKILAGRLNVDAMFAGRTEDVTEHALEALAVFTLRYHGGSFTQEYPDGTLTITVTPKKEVAS